MIAQTAGSGSTGNFGNDVNMVAFRQQLQDLDVMSAMHEALEPKGAPTNPVEEKTLVREQVSALKREEEHKQLVEAALEKLRVEREARAKARGMRIRQNQGAAQARLQQQQQQYQRAAAQPPRAPQPYPYDVGRREPKEAAGAAAAAVPPMSARDGAGSSTRERAHAGRSRS